MRRLGGESWTLRLGDQVVICVASWACEHDYSEKYPVALSCCATTARSPMIVTSPSNA